MPSIYLYDWLSFTTKVLNEWEVIDFLGMAHLPWQTIKGAHGYKDRLYYDGVSVHFNGNDNMGVWLELSGQGCRVFETFGHGDYDFVFRTIMDSADNYHLTRLDVAFDDHDGLLDIKRVFKDTLNENFVSKFSWYKHEAGSQGTTVYFGSPKSDIRIRIYDKAAERGKVGEHWIRVELQLRDDRALEFARRVTSNELEITGAFLGVIKNYLRFVVPQAGDVNKWRWPTARYWRKFLGAAEKITLYVKPGVEYNMAMLRNFVINQAGGAIDTYIQLMGLSDLKREIEQRSTPLNPKYRALIDNKPPAVRLLDW